MFYSKRKKITKIEIDILKNKVFPNEVNIKPLLYPLSGLREMIKNQLTTQEISANFIVSAVFQFEINLNTNVVYCKPILEDLEGNVYGCKKMLSESAFPINNLFIKNNERTITGKSFKFIKQFLKKIFKSLLVFYQTHF